MLRQDCIHRFVLHTFEMFRRLLKKLLLYLCWNKISLLIVVIIIIIITIVIIIIVIIIIIRSIITVMIFQLTMPHISLSDFIGFCIDKADCKSYVSCSVSHIRFNFCRTTVNVFLGIKGILDLEHVASESWLVVSVLRTSSHW